MNVTSQLTRSGKVLPGKLIVVRIAGYLTSHIGTAAMETFKLGQPRAVGVSIIGTNKDELGPSLPAGLDGLGQLLRKVRKILSDRSAFTPILWLNVLFVSIECKIRVCVSSSRGYNVRSCVSGMIK